VKEENTLNVDEFVKHIKDDIERHPENRYVFFIGAGCSIQSNIPGAESLTKSWLDDLKRLMTDEKYSEWFTKTIGNKNEKRFAKFYPQVIKRRFQKKRSRQQEIERIVDNGRESIGYIILANLLTSERYGKNFNILFTTNFDNLIAESIYRYTAEKSRVIGHDTLMTYVDVTTKKPQIVKLHGDAEFDAKNTKDETYRLPPETLETIDHVLRNSGLIFVGYGGNDESIIDALNQLGQRAITNGVYWIKNNLPESKLKNWLESRDDVFWIQHSNFDHLMISFLTHFEISRDRERCSELENNFQTSLENSMKELEKEKSENKQVDLRSALKKYVATVDDWIKLVAEANDVAKTNFDKSVMMYEEGETRFGENPLFLLRFGNLYHENNLYQKAIVLYDKCLKIDPKNNAALNNKGLALGKMGKYNEAIACFDELLQINSNDTVALNSKGFTLNNDGKHDDAMLCFDKGLLINPHDAIMLNNKGFALVYVGRPDQAIVFLDKSLEIDPNYTTALNNKGLALTNMGKHNEAIACFDKVIQIDPDNVTSLVYKGQALVNVGKTTESSQYFKMVFGIDKSRMHGDYLRGIAFHELGKYEDALACFDEELRYNPNDIFALNRKGLSLIMLTKYIEAEQIYEKILQTNPQFVSALYNFAILRSLQNKKTEALRILKKAIGIDKWLKIRFNEKDFKNIRIVDLNK